MTTMLYVAYKCLEGFRKLTKIDTIYISQKKMKFGEIL